MDAGRLRAPTLSPRQKPAAPVVAGERYAPVDSLGQEIEAAFPDRRPMRE